MMRYFFILCISLFLNPYLLGSDFSQKKIIKMKGESDHFELIDLNQKLLNPKLDEQKSLFDSSILLKKESNIKSKNKNFAIALTFRENFAYFLENFKVDAKNFSRSFSKNFINNLKLNLANRTANNLYQNSKTLLLSSKDAKLVNISAFLKEEKDKSKIYTDFITYLAIINLQDFYINSTNYFITKTQEGVAKINFKLLSTSNGKILVAKNIKLKLALKGKNTKENYQDIIKQMPKMLAQAIDKEIYKLKLDKLK